MEKVKYKELLRRVHLLHPNMLPADVLEHVRPDALETSGFGGTVSSNCSWEITETTAPSIIFNIHVSSDGVTPFKTEGSSVRCIMGRVDSLYSRSLKLTVPIPHAPPFLIGIYKGSFKKSDGAIEGVVEELRHLSPTRSVGEGRSVYVLSTAWIADAVEKSAVCGTVGTAGAVSCPRCEQEGTKKISDWQRRNLTPAQVAKKNNHMYFPKLSGNVSRENYKWEKYLEQTGDEVRHIIYPSFISIFSYFHCLLKYVYVF